MGETRGGAVWGRNPKFCFGHLKFERPASHPHSCCQVDSCINDFGVHWWLGAGDTNVVFSVGWCWLHGTLWDQLMEKTQVWILGHADVWRRSKGDWEEASPGKISGSHRVTDPHAPPCATHHWLCTFWSDASLGLRPRANATRPTLSSCSQIPNCPLPSGVLWCGVQFIHLANVSWAASRRWNYGCDIEQEQFDTAPALPGLTTQ